MKQSYKIMTKRADEEHQLEASTKQHKQPSNSTTAFFS